MAYGKHYILQSQSRNQLIFTLEIWEKDYVDAEETMECAEFPFIYQLLAQSDDPYLPIASSQQSISLYLQDVFDTVMPDFLTDDDRKYWIKIIANTLPIDSYVWQGFLLNDQVTIPFTTGRPNLKFDCTDGLALLKDIPYVPLNPDINEPETLLQVILTCLENIGFPDGYFLNVCVSYFAAGMQTRGDDPAAEPFSQIYMPPRNWLNSDMTYKSCYEILEEIMISFGCQLVQSEAQWHISSTNERFEDEILFTRYDQDGVVSVAGEIPLVRTVRPYLNPIETTAYFRDNSQTKILLKGFSLVKVNTQPRYSPNYIDNALLIRETMGFPTNWTFQNFGVDWTYGFGNLNGCTSFLLGRSSGTTDGLSLIASDSQIPAFANDKCVISTDIDAVYDLTDNPACTMVVKLASGSDKWYLTDQDGQYIWTNTPTEQFLFFDKYATQINITTPNMPISGVITVFWEVAIGITGPGGVLINTQPNCNFANFKISFQGLYSSQNLSEQLGTDTKYKKEVSVTMGYQGTGEANFAQQGALLDSSGEVWDLWGRYPKVDNYPSLSRLLLQQYINIFSKSAINFSAAVKSIYSNVRLSIGEAKGLLTPFQTFQVIDTTGTPISASGKSYIAGSSTINYIDDTIQVTMLETANTDIDGTITSENIIR